MLLLLLVMVMLLGDHGRVSGRQRWERGHRHGHTAGRPRGVCRARGQVLVVAVVVSMVVVVVVDVLTHDGLYGEPKFRLGGRCRHHGFRGRHHARGRGWGWGRGAGGVGGGQQRRVSSTAWVVVAVLPRAGRTVTPTGQGAGSGVDTGDTDTNNILGHSMSRRRLRCLDERGWGPLMRQRRRAQANRTASGGCRGAAADAIAVERRTAGEGPRRWEDSCRRFRGGYSSYGTKLPPRVTRSPASTAVCFGRC